MWRPTRYSYHAIKVTSWSHPPTKSICTQEAASGIIRGRYDRCTHVKPKTPSSDQPRASMESRPWPQTRNTLGILDKDPKEKKATSSGSKPPHTQEAIRDRTMSTSSVKCGSGVPTCHHASNWEADGANKTKRSRINTREKKARSRLGNYSIHRQHNVIKRGTCWILLLLSHLLVVSWPPLDAFFIYSSTSLFRPDRKRLSGVSASMIMLPNTTHDEAYGILQRARHSKQSQRNPPLTGCPFRITGRASDKCAWLPKHRCGNPLNCITERGKPATDLSPPILRPPTDTPRTRKQTYPLQILREGKKIFPIGSRRPDRRGNSSGRLFD